MHVGQLPEKFRLTAAQRHAGMIVPDETADDPVEGARPIKRWKSGGSHDVTSCDHAATSAPTRVPQGAESECDESRRDRKSVVKGKSVTVRGAHGGRRNRKKKKK